MGTSRLHWIVADSFQCVAYYSFSACGPNHLGAEWRCDPVLVDILINTEIKCGHLCVVCRGETPGRSGIGTILATSDGVIAICIAVWGIRSKWGVVRFAMIVICYLDIAFEVWIQNDAAVIYCFRHVILDPVLCA